MPQQSQSILPQSKPCRKQRHIKLEMPQGAEHLIPRRLARVQRQRGNGVTHEQTKSDLAHRLYELTMMQGYFQHKDQNETVIFDAFYRANPGEGGYSVAAGLEQVIQYIKELHFSEEDIEYLAGRGISAGFS